MKKLRFVLISFAAIIFVAAILLFTRKMTIPFAYSSKAGGTWSVGMVMSDNPLDIDVNNIKVNGSAVADSKMMLYTTLAHEGYPGHLYEFTSFYNNDEIPDIRKILDFIGATEGWAEYVSENALKYLDDLSENGAKMYALNDVLTYVVVSRLDIGVNYEGWDLDDAYDYLSAYFQTDKNYDEEDNLVSSLYYEVAGDPGAYLPYTLGHMFMNDMREKAEEELGDAFDAKEYHQWLLDVGVAPFNVYDSELDKWLAAKKQA